ncbi:MAG: hypothetical protein ACRD24_05740 [Terriglobales bacterium]
MCLSTAPLMADVQAAMLYAKGKTTVNGNLVDRSTAVFAGDQVRTGKDSTVSIALQGSNVSVMANSGVVFGNNTLTVSEGGATVVTSRGLTASVGGLRIAPAEGQKARFVVAHIDGKVRVSALEGRLSISDGKQTTMLDSGRQLTTAGRSLGNAPAGANSLAGAAIVILVAVVAGASIGTIIATTGDEPDTSPSTFNP